MGNYSTLYGEVSIENKNYGIFKKRFIKSLKDLDWLNFEELFIENDKYKDVGTMYLNFNPRYNEFKLLGYPDNFEKFFGLFRDNVDLINHFSIIADVEDASFFIFRYPHYDDNKFTLQMFRTDEGIKEFESYKSWHKDFINTLK